MKFGKIALAAAAMSVFATAASAAAPASSAMGLAAPTVQLDSSARATSAKGGRHSELTGAALPLAIIGAAAAGVGIAAAAGAFDSHHHNSASQ